MKLIKRCAALLLLAAPSIRAQAPETRRFSIDNMDRTVDPGTDFYKYSNGTWLKNSSIPSDQVTWGPTPELVLRNWTLLRQLLEKASEEQGARTEIEREVGDFYASAMAEKRAEELGTKPLDPDLAKIAALTSKTALAGLLGDFHQHGIGGFFSASVDADARNSDRYALSLTQGGLTLPDRDYYFAPRFAKERVEYERHIVKLLGIAGTPADGAATSAKVILRIEAALAKPSRKLEDLSDPITNYHKLTKAELQKLTPSFDWEKYFSALETATPDTAIVGQPEFFQGLEAVLKKYSMADIQTYLRWHLLTEAAPLLNEAAAAESFAFFGTVLSGQPKIQPRWKRATRRIDECLGEALGEIYIEHYFPPAAGERMDEMVSNIKSVYHDRLAKVPWMTEATRREAVSKFERFTAKIGAPQKFRDYSTIEIRRDDYLGNVRRSAAFESRREIGRIGKAVDRKEWDMTPPTVNAYFNPTMNEIVFPAGILQPPFFDTEQDDAVNYGATGATVGHEMTHGYDNEGRKYDASGNLRDWWTKADVKQFEARTQKLVNQFNGYSPLPGLHVNGKLTLAENIADLGGLSIAFEALERALGADPSKRKVIDGFTPEQRFFISFAQSWAAKERAEYLRQSLTTDTHAPDMLRGFAPLTNMQEFFDAFGIKEGAPLWRPAADRAVIW